MKVYVAARFGQKEIVKEIYKYLKKNGHSITHDWTEHESIKPYDENTRKATLFAERDIDGVLNCDVFILLSDGGGTGMYVELGAAIAKRDNNLRPMIFIIGDHISRCLFNYHPYVSFAKSIDEVLERIN